MNNVFRLHPTKYDTILKVPLSNEGNLLELIFFRATEFGAVYPGPWWPDNCGYGNCLVKMSQCQTAEL